MMYGFVVMGVYKYEYFRTSMKSQSSAIASPVRSEMADRIKDTCVIPLHFRSAECFFVVWARGAWGGFFLVLFH
jgi:hypothetical protein